MRLRPHREGEGSLRLRTAVDGEGGDFGKHRFRGGVVVFLWGAPEGPSERGGPGRKARVAGCRASWD